MVQNKVKQKVSLPSGVQRKSGHVSKKSSGPKRGQKLQIAPKKAQPVHESKAKVAVTKFINKQNEELLVSRAQASSSTRLNFDAAASSSS